MTSAVAVWLRAALVVAATGVVIASGPRAAAGTQEYQPVVCTAPKPYEGPAYYGGPIDLPRAVPLSSQPLAPDAAARLDTALGDALVRTNAGALSAAVATASGRWSATRSADGAATAQRLWWASAGKTATAVVIMQLVAEKRLSLDDRLARWLPAFPNARVITIDHLLRHTAGVFSANEDPSARADSRYRSPEETIAIARTHGNLFCPGQAWRYSNTGYTMLGLIIEAVEGRPYHEVVNARIAARLKLATFRALAPREEPADVASLRPSNPADPPMVPNWAYASGAIVSSADDMLVFWHALTSGELLGAAATPRLFDNMAPMFDAGTFYGRGVMAYMLPGERPPRVWLGHSGGAPGAKAVVAWSPSDHAFVAVALTGDGSAEAAANLLLRALNGKPSAVPQGLPRIAPRGSVR